MEKKPKIYIEITCNYDKVYPGFISQFRKKGFEVKAYYGNDYHIIKRDTIYDMFRDCDVCISCLAPVTAEMMDLAENLKLICTFGAGFDHIDIKAATERGIPVVNGRGGNATAAAEHVVGMMIALSRNFPAMDHEMRKNLWRSRLGSELHGKVAGIVGLGAVGSELARILYSGFNMKILANDPCPNPETAERYNVTYVDADTLFKQSDYVSIHIPLFPSTIGLVNRDRLSLMKPTAFLFNTSRGGIVDERALFNAVKNRRIAGAGLDVFEQEPYMDNIFAEFDNVITTTHCGANTPETVFRIAKLLTEDIEDVMQNKRPRQNVVNPEVYLETKL